MDHYRYTLIRYVPDLDRMEPINVGVILQGSGRIDVRLSPHAAKRKEIDTQVYRKWRQFFLEEVRGEQARLLQPEKTSPQFLTYLQQLCGGAVLLSRPLVLEVAQGRPFDSVLEDLYIRLVAPPETTSPAAAHRPTGRFRQIAEERQFLKRGMKRHTHVVVNDQPLWMAYRQVANGQIIAIDKVEVDREIGATANEIERLPHILELLPKFFGAGRKLPTRYFLLADVLQQPFTDQPEAEFAAMRDELETAVEQVKKAGGEVLRTVPETESLAAQLDQVLPLLEVGAAQE